MLFSRDDLLAATGGSAAGRSFSDVSRVVIDSRDVPDQALFVPIKGARFDGHDFIADAIANGAVAALASSTWQTPDETLPIIYVDDPEAAMARLAEVARDRSKSERVAVTGSVGKTTTKDALHHILSAFGPTHASIRSYNNHWGVPLTLANLPHDAGFGVFELGMNHAREIEPLSTLVKPHIALITTIAPAHIGELGSMEAIADAKAEIFAGLEPGGVAVINADHDHLGRLIAAAKSAGAGRIVTYGLSEAADWHIRDVTSREGGVIATVDAGDRSLSVRTQLAGAHNLVNLTGAAIVAETLGLAWDDIVQQMATFAASDGRGRTLHIPTNDADIVVIDESYNANPASVRAALNAFAAQKAVGRRVLVLGDMRELGELSSKFHGALVQPVHGAKPDRVILVGKEMAVLAELLGDAPFSVTHHENAAIIGSTLCEFLDPGDIVMLKGSNGVGLGTTVSQVYDGLTERFDAGRGQLHSDE